MKYLKTITMGTENYQMEITGEYLDELRDLKPPYRFPISLEILFSFNHFKNEQEKWNNKEFLIALFTLYAVIHQEIDQTDKRNFYEEVLKENWNVKKIKDGKKFYIIGFLHQGETDPNYLVDVVDVLKEFNKLYEIVQSEEQKRNDHEIEINTKPLNIKKEALDFLDLNLIDIDKKSLVELVNYTKEKLQKYPDLLWSRFKIKTFHHEKLKETTHNKLGFKNFHFHMNGITKLLERIRFNDATMENAIIQTDTLSSLPRNIYGGEDHLALWKTQSLLKANLISATLREIENVKYLSPNRLVSEDLTHYVIPERMTVDEIFDSVENKTWKTGLHASVQEGFIVYNNERTINEVIIPLFGKQKKFDYACSMLREEMIKASLDMVASVVNERVKYSGKEVNLHLTLFDLGNLEILIDRKIACLIYLSKQLLEKVTVHVYSNEYFQRQ